MSEHFIRAAVEILGTDTFTVAGNHILLNEFTPPLEDGGLPEQVAVEGEQLAAIMERAAEIAAISARAALFPNLEPDQFWFVVRVSDHAEDLTAWLDALRTDDPVAWAAASSKLEFAKFFERDHPFVEMAREALGIPAEQLDALWQYGAAV